MIHVGVKLLKENFNYQANLKDKDIKIDQLKKQNESLELTSKNKEGELNNIKDVLDAITESHYKHRRPHELRCLERRPP
jgi:maltodextrin utilization protein YvdJ